MHRSQAHTPPDPPLQDRSPGGEMPVDDRRRALSPSAPRGRLFAVELARWRRGPEPPVLLDVRPAGERAVARISGDLWIPSSELASRLPELPQGRPIVVYCHFGGQAAMAAELLRSRGWSSVSVLDGGIDEYSRVVDPTVPRYPEPTAGGLVLQQFPNVATGCLAYLLWDPDRREAAIVDPGRDVGRYRAAIREQGLTLRAILETHTHADHLAGHARLHEVTSAPIYLGRRSPAQYPHERLAEGESVRVGGSEIVVAETPGHTRDHLTLRSGGSVFCGDTLLPGACGRTDLGDGDPERLWESLTQKLLTLPDATEVYPAHYGPRHGLPAPERYCTTIGFERRTNEALLQPDRAAFLRYMTEGWPPKPDDFDRIVAENLAR